MSKTLVLFSHKNHAKGYIEMLFKRLSERAQRHGLTLVRGALKELHITIVDNKLSVWEALSESRLDSFQDVYFELWYKAPQQALAAATYLSRKNKPFFSKELLRTIPDTKVGELAVLADDDIPLADTFTSSNKQIKKVFAKKSTCPFEYPFILKDAMAYGGNNNFLIKSYAELKEILAAHQGVTFICQEFIQNDRDYRCIVLGGKVRLVVQRSRGRDDTHLNNTSKGAEGLCVPIESLPAQAVKDVEKATIRLNRSEFAGVDLLIDKNTGKHYILEVNQTPQIEIGAEVDVKMDALLSYMKERADHE